MVDVIIACSCALIALTLVKRLAYMLLRVSSVCIVFSLGLVLCSEIAGSYRWDPLFEGSLYVATFFVAYSGGLWGMKHWSLARSDET